MCAVEPEASWETEDMSYLETIGWDLQRGRKLTARKSRKREVYAGNTAPDLAPAQIDV